MNWALGSLLAAVGLLANLLMPGIALASATAGTEIRVAVEPSLTLELLQGCAPKYDQLASDSLLAARGGARAIDPNKLHHIFGRGGHGLDDVVKAAGSREAAFGAMEKAAQGAFDAGKLAAGNSPGVFQGVVNVGGVDVTVRGAVVDGVFRIGSAWRP